MKTAIFLALTLILAACNLSKFNQHSVNNSKNDKQNPSTPLVISADLNADFSAHWLLNNTIVIEGIKDNASYFLAMLDSKSIQPKIVKKIALKLTTLEQNIIQDAPHLAQYTVLKIDDDSLNIKAWLKEKIAVIAVKNNSLVQLAYIQQSKLLDNIYAKNIDKNEALGATITQNNLSLKLWAPTAKNVALLLFNKEKTPINNSPIQMIEDTNTGIWSTALPLEHLANYYQYQVTLYHPASQKVETLITTDPYSLSLSSNSKYSQIVDLNHYATKPLDWEKQRDNTIAFPEDNIFYETHIRDFSFADNALSHENSRGKYAAFSEQNSHGITHLKALRQAGINTIHLLPTFDIGTVNEEDSTTVDLSNTLASICAIKSSISVCNQTVDHQQTLRTFLEQFDPLSGDAQALITELKTIDKYNWGYDPFHYTVPEGSYAQNPEGIARILEFRQMIQSLHNMGFRVIMDVVYNHTHQARLERTSVLDKIVPNYYQRLHPISGAIEQSTCCDNTATENTMMAKLMIDSLVTWARDYKIDGFRFDLMAHQPKNTMFRAREAVRTVDADTYFYGEGWNFGEVANNQRFVQASQLELSGTEIGTFTDRLRDAVRGGAFSASAEDIRKNQGIGSGLVTLNNELVDTTQAVENYLLFSDQLRIGLAGNLANFPLENSKGKQVFGKDIPYGDQPAGYALDPADTINYVSKHDNQTLWDNNQYRLPFDLSTKDRVRIHLQSLAYPIFAQGIPFIHMGSELLRSKSFLRDSYDYNDWFNIVDFSMSSNNYNIGLPPAEKDEANWPLIKHIIENNQGRDIVKTADINFSKQVFLEMIKIRMSSPLFRLTTAQQIINRVQFHNTGDKQQIGLIAMSISDLNPNDILDPHYEKIMVIFNTSTEAAQLKTSDAKHFQLHPIQKQGTDTQVKQAKIQKSSFSIPALSTAVFVKARNKNLNG